MEFNPIWYGCCLLALVMTRYGIQPNLVRLLAMFILEYGFLTLFVAVVGYVNHERLILALYVVQLLAMFIMSYGI